MFKATRFALLLVALAAAASCGFQLQGALQIPVEMERTYIATEDAMSPFYRELRSQLSAAGVNLVDSASDSTAVFSITFEDTNQRVLSVSARNVPTEYEVYYTVEYDLDSSNKKLMSSQSITLTRDYTYDPTLVLGKAREEELLRTAIVDDLVRLVLKQISTL